MSERPTRCLLCEARLSNPICQLSVPSVTRFADVSGTTTYRPGETIFSQGDRAGDVFLIRSGNIKLTYEHPDGAEQLLRVAGSGETIGIGVSLNGVMLCTAVTRGGASVCRTRLSEIERLVQTDPDFALAWSHLLMDEIRRAREGVFNLGPHPAAIRLARLLSTLLREQAGRRLPGEGLPSVALTHSDLAASLAIAQETATRLLRDLEEKNIVRLSRGRIEILDPDRLLALGGYPGTEADVEQKL